MFPISWHLPCIFDYDGPHGLGIPLTPALVLVQGCEGVLGPGCRGHYGYDDNAQADYPHVVEGVHVLCYVVMLCCGVVWCQHCQHPRAVFAQRRHNFVPACACLEKLHV